MGCDFFYCCDPVIDSEELHGVRLGACRRHQDALGELVERSRHGDFAVLVSAFIPRLDRAKRVELLRHAPPSKTPALVR
jgi:hypothetical protein